MALKILDFNLKTEKLTYTLVPEVTSKQHVELIKRDGIENEKRDGFSDGRTMRKIGSIPYSVWYNYAIANGAEPGNIDDFYMAKKGKRVKALLKEFPVFKQVSKL